MPKGRNDRQLDELLQHGFRYAMSLTHDVAKAEDILQDAWVAVLNAISPDKQRESDQTICDKSYLFTAIRSRFINQYRRELLVPISSLDSDTYRIDDWQDIPADSFSDRDLHKLLKILRPVEREVLYLFAVEGYTAQEISDHTKQPRNTVLSLIRRAKIKLASSFSDQLKEARS